MTIQFAFLIWLIGFFCGFCFLIAFENFVSCKEKEIEKPKYNIYSFLTPEDIAEVRAEKTFPERVMFVKLKKKAWDLGLRDIKCHRTSMTACLSPERSSKDTKTIKDEDISIDKCRLLSETLLERLIERKNNLDLFESKFLHLTEDK